MFGQPRGAARTGALLVAVCSALYGEANAADLSLKDAPPAYYYSGDDFWTRPYLLGDLGRAALKQRGIDISATMVDEAVANASGGSKNGGANAGQLGVGAKFDMEKLAGIHGGLFGVTLVDRWGRNLNSDSDIPALQLTNEVFGRGNIVRLTEFYYDQKLFSGALELKGGRLPVGADFFFGNCDFINLTFCGGQPGNILGSYIYNWPVSQMAGVVKVNLPQNLQLQVGFYDANPNYLETKANPALLPVFAPSFNGHIGVNSPGAGLLVPVELNWKGSINGLSGIWKVGGWYNDADAATISTGRVESGLSGAYVSIWQQIRAASSYKDAPDPTHGLFTFFNASFGDQRTSVQDYQIAWGLQQVGTFASRPDDSVGFAVGTTHVNSDCRIRNNCGNVKADGNEVPIEVWYGYQATPWLNLKFDAQYVINPGGFTASDCSNCDNAWVFGLRTTVKF
jgi:porin